MDQYGAGPLIMGKITASAGKFRLKTTVFSISTLPPKMVAYYFSTIIEKLNALVKNTKKISVYNKKRLVLHHH
jgi:hypothetical protein